MNMEDVVQKTLQRIFHDDTIVFDKSRFAGGLTNYNYIMDIKGKEYVVRQPGGMTGQMIDREREGINNKIASELGLNSESIFFDENTGIKVSIYIKNSKNIAQTDPSSPTNLKSVSNLMKKIHSSPVHFPNTFDWIEELNKYEKIVRKLNGDFFYDYFSLKKKLIDFIHNNIKTTIMLPCHNDTVPENFLKSSDGRVYLIDWEYSGMNDPSWDIAAYILESKLTEEAIEYLFLDYYGKLPTNEEVLKIKSYMVAQDLLWTVWALIRHYNGEDFLKYCYQRYERFRNNMEAISIFTDFPISEMVKNE